MSNQLSVEEAKEKGLTSMDISEEKRDQFKQLFPEVFTEDKVDFDQLRRVLGDFVDADKERFGLNWPGKAECMKIIQQPSVATLRPARDESVDFDTAENLFIEGDNLEVLKLLQKAYFGKVKMIYIDPPYNTGKEFIYPDKYAENLDTYLEYTGQKDAEGRKFSTNSDLIGRYHSNWLNMMYPRLYLAKNLLREDGVIFISIDDHEVENLKGLCNSVFGEENQLLPLIWELPRGINAGHISKSHEYVLAYAKNKEILPQFYKLGEETYSVERCNKKIDVRHPASEIHFPAGIKYEGVDQILAGKISGSEEVFIEGEMEFKNGQLAKPVTLKAGWTMKNMIQDWLDGKEVYDTKGQKIEDFFFKSNGKLHSRKKMEFQSIKSVLKKIGDYQEGRQELESFFGTQDIFEYPKPSKLIQILVDLTTQKNDIILDFFAGSCPTAQATYSSNSNDNLARKYIMIQLPETITEEQEAFNHGYKTISELGQERIRRAAKKIAEENPDYNGDMGFKVFKLAQSNFNIWEGNTEEIDDLTKQLEMAVDHIKDASTPEDILYELLLKAGFPLTTKVEKVTMADKEVFSVEDGAMLICLEKKLTQDVLDAMAGAEPFRVVCLDEGFKGNDELKANAVQTFKSRARDKESAITFTTV